MGLGDWPNLVGRTEYSRAERHLRSTTIELETIQQSTDAPPWVAAAGALLADAKATLGRGEVEGCWHFIHAARRLMASGQDAPSRSITARVLRLEADKLSAWRRKSVEALLGAADAPSADELREALWVRDDYYENRYHRIDLQREQLRRLVTAGTVALIVIVVVSAAAPTPITALLPDQPWHWRVLLMVLSFGVLGASFSGARSITVKDLGTVIPELTLSRWITWARTLLGATLGLAAYTFLQSGLLNEDAVRLPNAAAVAFIGGFSEQAVLKMIGSGSRDDKAEK